MRGRQIILLLGGPGAGLWATVGLHPHDASTGTGPVLSLLDELAGDPVVAAVGECGLDYHYRHSPAGDQQRAFAEQIRAAERSQPGERAGRGGEDVASVGKL